MSRDLSDQVVVVTGGALNIGRAICLELAARGAAVVVNARSSVDAARALAEEITRSGGQASAVIADVTDPREVVRLMDAATARFGRLTGLVNNASLRTAIPFAEMTLEEWREVMAVVVEASFLCAQAAAPLIRDAGGGAIVNIGGLSGHRGATERLHVATAKAAVAGMVRSLARELAGDDIRVNCVSPGLIETVRGPTAGALPADYDPSEILLGRKGRPEEIAAVVAMLMGPGGGYVTGQTIQVNGGIWFE